MSAPGEGAVQQPQPQDRREQLLEGFNQIEARDAAAKAAEPTPEVTPPPSDDKVAAPDRPRDDAGKFVARPKEPSGQDGAAAQPVPAAPGPKPVASPLPTEPWMKAPDTWKKEHSEKWGALDPSFQQYIHAREQQMRAGAEQLWPKAALADKINEVAAPYLNIIQGLGLDLPGAVSGLMKVDHDLRTLPYDQKIQLLTQVARSYGIDLTGQIGGATDMGSPVIQQLQNELLAVKGQFQSFTQAQQAAQDQHAANEIEKFRSTAEYFEDVRPTMIQLLQAKVADDIGEAYEKAIRLHPEIFDKIQAAKQQSADAEKSKAADDAAKRAKAAAVSPKSATPGAVTATNAKDRRSVLSEAFDRISERL